MTARDRQVRSWAALTASLVVASTGVGCGSGGQPPYPPTPGQTVQQMWGALQARDSRRFCQLVVGGTARGRVVPLAQSACEDDFAGGAFINPADAKAKFARVVSSKPSGRDVLIRFAVTKSGRVETRTTTVTRVGKHWAVVLVSSP